MEMYLSKSRKLQIVALNSVEAEHVHKTAFNLQKITFLITVSISCEPAIYSGR